MINDINKINKEILESSMQIEYYKTAYNDYEVQCDEKHNQLITHYESKIKLLEKKIIY